MADEPVPSPVRPPSETNSNVTTIIKVVGAFLVMLSYGFKDASANHPDVISALGDWTDWGAVFGVLAVIGGALKSRMDISKTKAALEVQKVESTAKLEVQENKAASDMQKESTAPPSDKSGQKNALVTVRAAIGQAAHEENYSLVKALTEALEKEKGRKNVQA